MEQTTMTPDTTAQVAAMRGQFLEMNKNVSNIHITQKADVEKILNLGDLRALGFTNTDFSFGKGQATGNLYLNWFGIIVMPERNRKGYTGAPPAEADASIVLKSRTEKGTTVRWLALRF